MLLAYLCWLDKGNKKHRPEALKTMKVKFQGLQNPFQKQLESDTASEEAFEPQFFRNFVIFEWILASKNEPKIEEKMLKTRCATTIHFWINFCWNFLRFGFRKRNENSLLFGSLSKNLILWKSWYFQRKLLFFWFWASRNRPNFDVKTLSKMTSKKKGSKIEFGHRFLVSQNHQNCCKKRC